MFTAEQVDSFFANHWTVRKYKKELIPKDHIDIILNAGQRAPTDATAQMYTVLQLEDLQLRQKIASLTNNAHIEFASHAFIICADINRLEKILQTSGFNMGQIPHVGVHFGIGDAVMCGQNMLTAAEMLGYKGCWIGGVLSALNEISQILNLPQGVFPFAGLTLGIPDESPQKRPRLARELVHHVNSYKNYSAEELQKGLQDMAPITQNGNWGVTLNRYFGAKGNMEARDIELKNYLTRQISSWNTK